MEQSPSLAVFCDYENLALGAKDAKLDGFDVSLALERLLDKGKIVFKKAYADWERYKSDRKPLHEHAFELVEIPHVSYSGKNSADIRMVVDALDLCYTKSHVDTFAILTGDSDFSPLVSKLRENNKEVIGLGVKSSTSNLLVENCDEFIYYDDLVQKKRRPKPKKAKTTTTKKSTKSKEERREEAFELVMDTIESMIDERDGTLWAPSVRRAIKRKRPNFVESYYGYRGFNQIIEDGEKRGILTVSKDVTTGHYAIFAINRE